MKNNIDIIKFFAKEAFIYASPLLTIDPHLNSEFEEWWDCFRNNLEYKDLTGRWYDYTPDLQESTHLTPLNIRVKK